MRGKFIVFEGISGTGKETQALLLQQYLADRNIVSHIVYHPATGIKPILSYYKKERHADWKTMTYLLLADRYNTVNQVISPALARGEWIISLRSFVSALVYQGDDTNDRAWIAGQFSKCEPVPDILFYFDINPEDALERIHLRHQKTGESIGSYETIELLGEMRKRYKNVIRTYKMPAISLNAKKRVEATRRRIASFVKPLV